MGYNAYLFLIYSFIAYGVTTIVVYGDIFSELRDWIGEKSEFVHSIFTCPLCFSTWLGFFMSTLLQIFGGITPTEFFGFNFIATVFLDGCLTAGVVWFLNGIKD